MHLTIQVCSALRASLHKGFSGLKPEKVQTNWKEWVTLLYGKISWHTENRAKIARMNYFRSKHFPSHIFCSPIATIQAYRKSTREEAAWKQGY